MNVSRIGSQRPTLLHEPPDAVDWRLSDIAVEWARDVLGIVLDEWQEWMVRWTFARRPDGMWAARDVGGEVPRQNGKNIWLEVVELVGVFEFGDRLITHSAHRSDVSHEHFVSMKEHIEASDALMRMMPPSDNRGFVTANGQESIRLENGARILFKARAKSSGRGPRPQKIVFDEALVLEQSQIGSMAPGISAQKNAQIIFASSPPMASSSVLHAMRARAINPEPGDRLFYAAWNNPPDTDVHDRDAWYLVNPSLGYGRLTEDSLMANRKLMDADEYRREHMGIPEVAEDDATEIPNWDDLRDDASAIASHHRLALDVAPKNRFAAIGAAGRRADGRLHVEAVYHAPGTGWIVDKARASWDLLKIPFIVQAGSPAAAFVSRLREVGVEVDEVTASDHAAALGALRDAAESDGLRHIGQNTLSSAVRDAEVRISSDGAELWGRRTSKVDITTLVAVTLAAGAVPAPLTAAAVDNVW